MAALGPDDRPDALPDDVVRLEIGELLAVLLEKVR